MDADLKKILKAVVLEMRHELEGYYDNAGKWFPGDLEQRLAEIGVRKDRESAPVDELALADEDVAARKIIDAYISLRQQAGVERADAVAEYVRESAYTWANRLVALRCMEARELLDDEVIVGREAYGGRSLVHHRLAQSSPELCTGEDDGRFAMLAGVFAERAETLPMLFDPESPSIALRPSPPALKNCLAWLSGTEKVRSHDAASDEVFAAPDALGWAYQYWNAKEKARVFEKVKTKKGAKIEGADIIPATQLYTEDYMVKFLVQNSLGATWMGMHPESQLLEGWEYYVRDADRALAKKRPLRQITLLDPACGSGHFLIEAFDMLFAMYEGEGEITEPEEICKSILENNLFGIDIDERSIQIAEASLWMKAEEKAFGFSGATTNLVAATSSHLKGESWERYLTKLENEPSTVRVLRKFAVEMEHIDELGSLARPAEALESIIKEEHELWEKQERERHQADKSLFKEIRDDVLASQLPFHDITDRKFFERTMQHALFAIDGFTAEARESGEFNDQLMGVEAKTGFRLLDLLSRKYDVVVANPPYMGKRKQGKLIAKLLAGSYKISSEDIYAAFLDRALSLLDENARFSFVTMFGYTCLPPFAKFRQLLLESCRFEVLAHVGTYAFQEMGDHVNGFLTIGAKGTSDVQIISILDCQSSRDKVASLKMERFLVRVPQGKFARLPNSSFAYWFPDELLEEYGRHASVGEQFTVSLGLSAVDNNRIYKRLWEVDLGKESNWRPLMKGGQYDRWAGVVQWAANWVADGANIKALMEKKYPYLNGNYNWKIHDPEVYFGGGVCYTNASSWGMGAREMPKGAIFEDTAPGIIPPESANHSVTALLNCAAFAVYAKLVNPSVHLQPGDVRTIPLPALSASKEDELTFLSRLCTRFKKRLQGLQLDAHTVDWSTYETALNANSLTEWCNGIHRSQMLHAAGLAVADGIANLVASVSFVGEDRIPLLLDQIERPVGWIGKVYENEALHLLNEVCSNSEFERLVSIVQSCKFDFIVNGPNTPELTIDVERVEQFLSGELTFRSTKKRSEDDESVGVLQSAPQSDVDAFSRELQCNPLLICKILLENLERGSLFFTERSQSHVQNLVGYLVLRVLGEDWHGSVPSQQVGVDEDGIIPLTIATSEMPLSERLIEIFDDGPDTLARDVGSVLGSSLNNWLAKKFFGEHVSAFSKRPIAWQLQTSSYTSHRTPAFACLAYYHRMDADALPKIRTQYTGPLKLRFETEMRGISSTPATSRTDNQAKRAVELEEAIAELQAFDEKLAAIAKSGFGPPKLLPKLRQYAFDDAMLAMKARWLKRLSELLDQSPGEEAADGMREASPLDQWQGQAIETELHPEFADWIGEALSNLDYFCSQVDPKAPEAKKTPDDPTAADLAELIRPETITMQTRSIELACGVWWGKFDAAVLAPIRERIKQLKAEQKELNAEIKRRKAEGTKLKGDDDEAKPEPATTEDTSFHLDASSASLKERFKDVKAKIKKFTDEINVKAGKAQAIRDAIQAWSSSEPDQWHDWLAEGPMYDQVASLDDRRTPPKTIAEFIDQESLYAPDINDGVRVNIAPLQKAGVLAADVLAAKDVDKAIADRAEWRSDERRWVREGKLPQCGWWAEQKAEGGGMKDENLLVAPGRLRPFKMDDALYSSAVLCEMLLQRPDGMQPIELAQAFCLLTRKNHLRDALVKHVPQVDSEQASKWHGDFDQQPQPEMLRTQLEELMSRQFATYDGSVLVPGEKLTPSKNAWLRHDVALSLAAAEAMPAAERDEIVEPEVQEMIFKLRLVG